MPTKFWSSTKWMAPSLWYNLDGKLPPEALFGWELGGYCTHDGFYINRMPLAYMAVFRKASLQPRPSNRSWVLFQLGYLSPQCRRYFVKYKRHFQHALSTLVVATQTARCSRMKVANLRRNQCIQILKITAQVWNEVKQIQPIKQ